MGRGLPIDQALPVRQLLTHFIELQDVVSRQTLRALAQATRCPFTKQSIEQLASDDAEHGYATKVARGGWASSMCWSNIRRSR
jgi:cytochrome P450/NADPH-cytochrome P450 reductase